MKQTQGKRFLSLLLCVMMVLSLMPITAFAEETSGKITFDGSDDGYNILMSKKDYAIAPGVTESNLILNDSTGQNQNKAYVFQVDSGAETAYTMASYKDLNGRSWGTQVMSAQAAYAEENLGVNVVGAINVNLRFGSDEPMGMLVINGDVQHEEAYSYGYFVQNKDGSFELRDGSEPLTGNEWNAVTCTAWLVKDGHILWSEDHSQGSRAPRTAIGLKADGSLVMLVNDGRNVPTSMGFTMYETAKTMLDLGCVNVINCDGGGTSTFISEREGTGELKLRNVPSDGAERATLTGLLIVSTATATGEFDHASVSPDEEYYTPSSEVALSAIGVDSSGAAANTVPETLTWRLSDASSDMGEIKGAAIDGNKATATFASNGKSGEVAVQLLNGDAVVGESTFYIADPDTLAFDSDTLNLQYEQVTDLGLTAKYQGKTVNLKADDIKWTISSEKAGTFDGLNFKVTDNYLASVSATVTATYKTNAELTDSMTVNVGMQPSVVLDGGDTDGLDYTHFGRGTGINGSFTWQENVNEGVLYDENSCDVISYHYMNNATSSRGGKEYLELVTSDMDEWTDIIRFGNSAVKINYDFTETNGIEGACLGFANDILLTGSPTAIGAWIYAPEGTPNFWLRAAVKVGDAGSYTYVNFTEQCAPAWAKGTGDVGGINWTGWKYVEADLTAYQGQQIRIIRGETIRVMDCFNNYGITIDGQFGGQGSWTKDGTYVPRSERKGYILVDNLQFVYGANNEDVTEPTISKISVIDDKGKETELVDGMTITDEKPMMRFYYDDNELTDKYATGVVTKLFYVDGGLNGSGEDFSGEGFNQLEMNLSQGSHSLKCYVKDKNGNVTTKTVHFNVDSKDSGYPSIGVSYDKDAKLYLGDTYRLNVYSDVSATNTKEVYAKINMSKNFTVQEIIPAAGYAVDRQSYKDGVLEFAVKPDGEETSGTTVATVVVKVPANLSEGSSFEWRVEQGWISTHDDPYTEKHEKLDWGFATPTVKLTVASKYSVSAETMIVGFNGDVTVLNENGEATANVGIYNASDDTLIGETNEKGVLNTDYFTKESGKWSVYAKDANGAVSFPFAVSSYPTTGEDAPYYILVNATSDPAHSKNITWMTNPDKAAEKAVLRISTAADMSGAAEIDGTCNRVAYKTTNAANYSNGAVATGLTANTTYYYQVGDGTVWSDIRSFTTAKESSNSTNFFILGDMQGADAVIAAKYSELLKASGNYAFGVQLGDAVDDVNAYNEWQTTLGVFSQGIYADTDILHVIGNHETFGDSNADAARSIFGSPSSTAGGYYSCEYGQVYVATLGYSLDTNVLQAQLDWLVEDAQKSDCPWKILVVHVPTYYSNGEQSDSLFYTEKLPAAAEKAGITCVFSGHDHSYARTDDLNGVTYYIAGTAGEKKYTCSDNGFAFVKTSTDKATPTQDFNSIYVTGYATAGYLCIEAYDVDANGNKTLFDKKTWGVESCDEHVFSYNLETDLLTCSVCKNSYTAKEIMYSGWATEENSGKYMYFVGGNKQTGYLNLDSTFYLFDENGFAYQGEYTLCGETCKFEKGRFVESTNATVLDAGKVGTNAAYVIYSDGTMVIDGTGKTYDYENHGSRPFIKFARNINSVKIGSDIEYIGLYMFAYSNVSSVEFAEHGELKYIGAAAFYQCNNLKTITIPSYVNHIGNNTFANCTNLSEIVISSGTTKMHYNTFKNSTDVTLYVEEGSYAHTYAVEYGIQFALTSKPVSGDIVSVDGVLYYYKNGSPYYAGLFELDGNYYYARSSGQLVVSRTYWVTKTNDLLPAANYQFDSDGKLLNAPSTEPTPDPDPEPTPTPDPNALSVVSEDGVLYCYRNGNRYYAGLFELDGSYYYARSSGQLVVSRTYWVTKTNDLLPAANYQFDSDGKLLNAPSTEPTPDPDPEPTPTPDPNALSVVSEDGVLYCYRNGNRYYAGLFELDGSYYYARSSGQLVVSRTYWVTKTNDLLPAANYQFGSDGKILTK